jgi:cobalt/nickel transport system permease protein
MTGVFFVGSAMRIPLGPTSLHLLLTGFIGLAAGRRAPIPILIALLLQLFLLQFGGLSSLGANMFMTAFPAMLLGMIAVPLLNKHRDKALIIGAASGFLAVVATVLLLGLILAQSNMRFNVGPFSTIRILAAAHVPLMIAETVVTAFAVQTIIKIRPEFLCGGSQPNQEGDAEI